MKKLIAAQIVGVLALLCSSVSMAALVTVVPSTLTPTVGQTFTVTLVGSSFSNMGGGTIDMSWTGSRATFTSAALPATGPLGVGSGTFVYSDRAHVSHGGQYPAGRSAG